MISFICFGGKIDNARMLKTKEHGIYGEDRRYEVEVMDFLDNAIVGDSRGSVTGKLENDVIYKD